MADLDTLTITRGDDAAVILTIRRNGAPMDLTGLEVTFQAVNTWKDTTAIIGPIPATLTDPTNGVCQVDIPAADSADLVKDAYLWDALVTGPNANLVHVARGVAHILGHTAN